jgi:hypothetical protein
LGCCIDIYTTCLCEDFDHHPFQGIVAEAAKLAGMNLAEFRYRCLKHQLEVARVRFCESEDARYREAVDRIQRLIVLLKGDVVD